MADKNAVGGLKWVKDEIFASLQRVRVWLEKFVEQGAEESNLNDAVNALSEVRGVLSALQLIGPARLTEEMQTLCEDLQAESLPNRGEAAEALMLALIQLPDYLDKLEAGQADIPLALLPSINDLRGTRGAAPLSEAELLVPASVLAESEVPAPDVQRSLGQIAGRVRPRFHLHLLEWLKDDTSREGLVSLGRLFHRLQRYIGTGIFHELFLVSEAVVEALLEGSIAADARIKALVSHLDRVFKPFATDPEAWPQAEAQGQLFDLLSLIARCQSSSYRVNELRTVYGLEPVAAGNGTTSFMSAGGPGPEALRMLVAEARKELTPFKDALDLFARGSREEKDQLLGLEPQLRSLANTLSITGADDMVDRLRRCANELGAMGRGTVPTDDQHLMTVAEELVTVETALGDLGSKGRTAAGNAEAQTLRSHALDEALVEMAKAEQAISDLTDTPGDLSTLKSVPALFHRVSSALRVLAEEDAADVLDLVAENLEKRFLEVERAPVQVELDLLAQAISGIDLYMAGLSEGQPYRSDLIAEARRAADELTEEPLPSPHRTIEEPPDESEETPSERQGPEAAEPQVPTTPVSRIDPEFLEVFLEEVVEEEQAIREQFAHWREDESDDIALSTLRRSFHTLKGSGRLVGANRIGEFSRAVEMLLNRVIDRTLSVSPELMAFMGEAVEVLPELITAEAQEAPLDVGGLIARADSLSLAAPGEMVARQAVPEREPRAAKVIPWPAAALSQAPAKEGAPGLDASEAEALAGEEEAAEIAALAEADDELLDIFRVEAREHLAVLRSYVARSEGGGGPAIPDEPVVRALHTLTGSARMTGVASTARVTAPLERLFGDHQRRGTKPGVSLLGVLVPVIDAMEMRLANLPGYGEEMAALRALSSDLDGRVALLESGVRDDFAATPEGAEKLVPEESSLVLEEIEEAAPDDEISDAEVAEQIVLEEELLAAEVTEEIVLEEELLAAEVTEEIVSEEEILAAEVSEEVISEDELLAADIAEEVLPQEEILAVEASEGIVRQDEIPSGEVSEEVAPEAETFAAEIAEEFVLEEEGFPLEISEEVVSEAEAISAAAVDEEALDEEITEPAVPAEEISAVEAAREVSPEEEVPAPAAPLEAMPPPGFAETPVHEPVFDVAVPSDGEAPAIAAQGVAPLPQDQELITLFLEDAREIVDRLDHSLRDLQLAPTEHDPLEEMQRSLHTLKGSARLSGLAPIGDLSHAFESLLTAITNGVASVDDDTLELAQRTLDTLSDQIDAVEQRADLRRADDLVQALALALEEGLAGKRETTPDVAVLAPSPSTAAFTGEARAPSFTRLVEASKISVGTAAETAAPQIRVRSDLLNRLVNNAGEISIYRSRLAQQGGLMSYRLGELDRTVDRLRDQLRHLEIETEAQILHRFERDTDALAPGQAGFDPLELDRFSTLQQLSRSLAETVNDLGSLRTLLQDLQGESDTLLQQQARIAEDLQDGMLRTRMVPFVQAVPRLHRVVRQTAQQMGKEARLEVFGPEVELDRSIQERIVAPLEHLLRNAVAHGIETPDQREREGKDTAGVVSLILNREGNDVVITVADDGAGLDLEAIRRQALDRGLIAESAEASEEELTQLILESGFSTVDQVSQISGRGVGLDVVNSEVKQLSGSVGLETHPGRGTSLTIRLPLTLAIIEALLVQIGDQVFAIPHTTVEAASRIARADLDACYQGQGHDYTYAGRDYRVMYLGSMLQVAGVPDLGERRWHPVLLARSGDQRIAFHLDQLIGTQRIVVKPLGPELSSVRWLSGGTILPDGRVAMIIDLLALIRSAAVQDYRPPVQVEEEEQASRPCVLVVDDSLTVRRVTSRILQRQNMDVITATDGIDALTRLEERVPNVILLDIEMPRMDGYELTRHLRRSERFKEIPVIMITSRTGEKHRRHALELGVDRYLGKPYQEAELLDEISSVLVEATL